MESNLEILETKTSVSWQLTSVSWQLTLIQIIPLKLLKFLDSWLQALNSWKSSNKQEGTNKIVALQIKNQQTRNRQKEHGELEQWHLQ